MADGGVRVGGRALGAQQYDHRGRPEPQRRTACVGARTGERGTQTDERRGPAGTGSADAQAIDLP
ncbi:hypothetical protein [Streptomyces sp. NPDC046805]|uniref:hypothetical protein n=1 Tax=Streptomyces sp. NPDC046805 TaxID=3155134 RepID=UPI0033E0E625